MTFSIILPVLVIILLLIEALLHRRWLDAIPLRIHINGTRGKSTVTRYIAAGLAADGRRPLAKITGDAPLLILPDGTFKPIRRLGKARVQEQLRIIY
ncbi:MAG: poly-gamma-glutamate synthase PgsB, partial [Candidatus Neomarinimicrobiota bacterium]